MAVFYIDRLRKWSFGVIGEAGAIDIGLRIYERIFPAPASEPPSAEANGNEH